MSVLSAGGGSFGPGNAALIRHVLKDWWPPRMASAACAGDLHHAMQLVENIVLTRTEEKREQIREDQEREEIDWDGLLSDFMAVYSGHSWEEVMQMPWPAFLNMARFEGRQRARTWLTYLKAKALPHMDDDKERQRAHDALRKQAGYPTSHEIRKEKQPDSWKEQKAAIEALDQYAP